MAQSPTSLTESSDYMKILLDMRTDMGKLSVNQENIKEDVQELKKIRASDGEKIASMSVKLNRISDEIDNKKQAKKESRNGLIQWVSILIAIGTLVSYIAYEYGVHTPMPNYSNGVTTIMSNIKGKT